MINMEEVLGNIKKLEDKAERILAKKRQVIPRRPILIEFCGSPKSGKSSCINSLDLFLRRNGYATKVLTERASVCPINSKHDPFFNIWTASSIISELSVLLANNSKDYDILILDRGIFDALCWFEWLKSNQKLDEIEHQKLEIFFTLDRWIKAIDLIYIFTVTSEVSFEREYANLLTRKEGSIMKAQVLKSYINSINNTKMKFENTFRRIELLDTSNIKLNDVNYSVTDKILDILDDYTSERIGYVNLNNLMLQEQKYFYYNNIFNDIGFDFESREKVESDEDKVQPIPVAIITNKERSKILVAKKNKKQTSENSPESNKLLVYFGGHTRKEDLINQKNNMMSLIRSSLTREVKEETNLDFTPSGKEFDNPLCIWDRSNEKSKKHIAICHVMEVDFDTIKYKLDKNEFITGGNTLSGKIYSKDDIFKEYDKLEPWSQIILENFFGYKTLFTNND